LPDKNALRAIYAIHTRGKTLAPDVDLDALVKASPPKLTGANVEWICRRASYKAIQRAIEGHCGLQIADSGLATGASAKVQRQAAIRAPKPTTGAQPVLTVTMADFQTALAEQTEEIG
jgi:transitional endoplasmic reticulum ATPase